VDAAALGRGSLGPGEVCEVAGVGPVSLTGARRLLGDALLSALVVRGSDVAAVSSTTRSVPQALRLALVERDPECAVPHCRARFGLEVHHVGVGFALGGPTTLENLARVCKRHHDMITYRGWHLGGGPGQWEWLGPWARKKTPAPGVGPLGTTEGGGPDGTRATGPPPTESPPRARDPVPA
jgi:hypothetical protein